MHKKNRLEFNQKQNSNCLKKCNKEKRKQTTQDDLCKETVSITDHLPVRCVGGWAMRKIFHLIQYFGIFTIGMKTKWEGHINYIEICSGPGICVNRENGEEFNGTSICIIEHQAREYVENIIFFDYNETVVNTLNKRISSRNIRNAKAIVGDYYNPDSICNNIINETKGKGLNLIFIDPTDCSVPFSLIQKIKEKIKNVDFIVNFAIRTDVNRNIRNTILYPDSHANALNKYKSFLGSDNFFINPNVLEAAQKGNQTELRKLFREEYMNSLRKLGYLHFDFKQIENYYDLVFASSHPKGIEFWNKANAIGIDGQRSLFEYFRKMKNEKQVFGTYEWAVENANYINGCSHNCKYCYSREMAIRFKRKTILNWEEEEVNYNQLERKAKKVDGVIMFPSSHDITPENLNNSIKFLNKLLKIGNEVLVVTKPHLSVIKSICGNFSEYKNKILFRFTIGSSNSKTLKFWEPNAPDYQERKKCLIYAYENGFSTSVSCEPMLDDNILELVNDLCPYVTNSIWLGKMNFLLRRLKMNGIEDNKTITKAKKLIEIQSDTNIIKLYSQLSSNEKIKWKESIKKVVQIEIPTIKGLDK